MKSNYREAHFPVVSGYHISADQQTPMAVRHQGSFARQSSKGSMEVLPSQTPNVLLVGDNQSQAGTLGSRDNVLTGVPRKTSLPPPGPTPRVPPSNGVLERVESSSSEESGEEEEEGVAMECTAEEVLAAAGVELANLGDLSYVEGKPASLELLSEFLSCVMRQKYEAAKVLCEKVLQLEPTNQCASEYLPVLVERLQTNTQLSSSEGSEGTSDEDDSTPSGHEDGSTHSSDEGATLSDNHTSKTSNGKSHIPACGSRHGANISTHSHTLTCAQRQ